MRDFPDLPQSHDLPYRYDPFPKGFNPDRDLLRPEQFHKFSSAYLPREKAFFNFDIPQDILSDEDIYQLNRPNEEDNLIRQAMLHYAQYERTDGMSEREKNAFYRSLGKENEWADLTVITELDFYLQPKYSFPWDENGLPLRLDRHFHDMPARLQREEEKLLALWKQRTSYLRKLYPRSYNNKKLEFVAVRENITERNLDAGLPGEIYDFDSATDLGSAHAKDARILYSPQNLAKIQNYLQEQEKFFQEMLADLQPYHTRMDQVYGDLLNRWFSKNKGNQKGPGKAQLVNTILTAADTQGLVKELSAHLQPSLDLIDGQEDSATGD